MSSGPEDAGSRYLKAPFGYAESRVEATERIMALQFQTVEKRLERIEALIEGLEWRLWMAVYGVVAVVLVQAVQSILDWAPR